MKLPIVILVGGLGKRLGNKVKNTPKPLLKINKKPFLEIVLNNLIKKGFKKIILCTGYLGYKIDNLIKKKSLAHSRKQNARSSGNTAASPN